MLQGAIIALVLGYYLRKVPASSPALWWPYALGGYALMASIFPWLLGGVDREEFSIRSSVGLGIVYAIPMAASAYWLDSTPYRLLSLAFLIFAAGPVLHLLVSVALGIRGR